jgi:uncharacterized damage-inducible protein DinB
MKFEANQKQLLQQLVRHQAWADAAHWKLLHDNPTLLEDVEIRKRMNHMLTALRALTGLAQGIAPDASQSNEIEAPDQLEAAMAKAHADLVEVLDRLDLGKMVPFPRGPQGPWEAPAGVVVLQAITHGQHHRGQNASRMRQLGATPPLTDFVIWYALARP